MGSLNPFRLASHGLPCHMHVERMLAFRGANWRSTSVFFIRIVERITRFFNTIAALLVLPLVGALVFEVFSRYVLGVPTAWAYEVSYMLMGAIFMLGMANALRIGQHVNVDVLSTNLPLRGKAALQIIGYVIFVPTLLWLVYELIGYAYQAFQSGEASGRSAWNPVVWPIFTVWCVGFLTFLLQAAVELSKAVVVVITGTEFGDRV